jgi:carboxymethylenebutenolidase
LIEKEIEIRTTDGSADGVFYAPDSQGNWPGVIFLTDIGGIRPSQRQMASRIADTGYAVLMPNVFYRSGRPPLFEAGIKPGDERFVKRMGELTSPLTPEAVTRDGSAYVDFLASQEGVKKSLMGVVGVCFTGAVAMRIAAARADKIGAAASFHGGRLVTDTPASPHLLLPRIKARLYFGHAVNDKSMPQEAIEKLDRALEEWGGRFESEVYEGAYHSWTVPDSPVYNAPQAERAFAKLKELLSEALR